MGRCDRVFGPLTVVLNRPLRGRKQRRDDMKLSRRGFLSSSAAASAAAIGVACTSPRSQPGAEPAAAPSQLPTDAIGPLQADRLLAGYRTAKGRMRVDFIGLHAFVVPSDDSWISAALVKAEAAGTTFAQHLPSLAVTRYAIDKAKSTLRPAVTTETYALFSLADTEVSFTGVRGGARVQLGGGFKIHRNNGPGTFGACPAVGRPETWGDFDWVLAAEELQPGVKLLPNNGWRAASTTACLVDIKAGVIEDPGLGVDSDRYLFEYDLSVGTAPTKRRALKENVRYTVEGAVAGIDAIDIDVKPMGGGATSSVRCNLSTPDPQNPQAGDRGVGVQIVHMPYGAVHGGLHDLRALYLLTDPNTRPSDLSAIPVPTASKAICHKTEFTSECGCCPPLRFHL